MSRVYLDCPATVLQIHFKDLKLKGTHGNFFKKVQGKIIRTLKYNRKKKKKKHRAKRHGKTVNVCRVQTYCQPITLSMETRVKKKNLSKMETIVMHFIYVRLTLYQQTMQTWQ